MAQRTDLYSILVSYSNKYNSPFIEIEKFLDFLGKYAKKLADEQPEWRKWLQDRTAKFWSEISILAEDNKCELIADSKKSRTNSSGDSIYMPHFYRELLEGIYQKAANDADIPFPSEETLKITLPDDQVKTLIADSELHPYLDEIADEGIPDNAPPIIKISFPQEFGSALALTGMVPRQLTEMAILKLRNYLRKQGNNEYALRKLTPQLQGRETFLKDQLNRVQLRPLDCYNAMEEGGENSYLFWAHFCILIKNDVKKKKELLNDDIAAMQAVYIIETLNMYFKSLAVKQKEKELALKSLEGQLAKPPFVYDLGQILKFKNSRGVPLLSQYTNKDLEEWLRKKTTESENDKLPELLILHDPMDERCFLLKTKMLNFCVKLLSEARPKVKDELTRRWRALICEYQSEPAMENEAEFENLLAKLTEKCSPMLTILLKDPKLLLVNDEMEQHQNGIDPMLKLFSKGQLLPYSTLLFVRRKDLLSDTRLILPFWYSMPVITAIIAFFRNLMKTKTTRPPAATYQDPINEILEENDQAAEIRAAAEELEFILVPPGYKLENFLEELESRWSRLIDKKARDNLIEDVKSLIRDNLRRNLRVQKKFVLTQEIIEQMAVNIITRTPSLSVLSGRDSLVLYAELYLIKLLENIRSDKEQYR